jgi:hypothetical protein
MPTPMARPAGIDAGLLGRGGMGGVCDPRGAGLAEWRFHADLLQSKIREILDAMQEPCLDAGQSRRAWSHTAEAGRYYF